jgi:hypothetical protein
MTFSKALSHYTLCEDLSRLRGTTYNQPDGPVGTGTLVPGLPPASRRIIMQRPERPSVPPPNQP